MYILKIVTRHQNQICIQLLKSLYQSTNKWYFPLFTFNWFLNGLNLPPWLLLWPVWSRFGLMRASFDSSHFLLLSYLLLLGHSALKFGKKCRKADYFPFCEEKFAKNVDFSIWGQSFTSLKADLCLDIKEMLR